MPHKRLDKILVAAMDDKRAAGALKGTEQVITAVMPPRQGRGPRYRLAGHGNEEFLRMNSNSYLGMSFNEAVINAEEKASREFGTGPGAVRFISGTWSPHVELENKLAGFHDREAAMVFSSAYATMMGLLPGLVTEATAIISDELNHSCIINAMALARPAEKHVYAHLDMEQLEASLVAASASCQRVIVVTDGIFSMRGDHAPLDTIMALANKYDEAFAENVLVVVDDSHGVGAFGPSGRGTEEYCADTRADILVGTLGKAFGVNGGYLVAGATIVDFLRETSPFYIYSNPITPAKAAAARAAVDIVDSPRGRALLQHLRAITADFEQGLLDLGLETIVGEHPVVPLMIRDTDKTAALVKHLRQCGILATGLNHPVVPRGSEEIRFQMCADHTPGDIDQALEALRRF